MKKVTKSGLRRVGLAITCGVSALAALGSAGAVADPLNAGDGAIFRLDAESRYQEGCFPPCLCPIMEQNGLRGTLILRRLGDMGGSQRYAVDDVNWTLPMEPPMRIVGHGRYTIGSPGMLPVVQHRLELDLAVGDRSVEHFDSGWVALTDPEMISITVSLNGMYCSDTAIVIHASRVPDEEIRPYALVQGSTFQRGCFDPCDCPLEEELRMDGTFALVPLIESLPLTEFAVVDVRWQVRSAATPTSFPVTGFGVYQLLGDLVLQHRLALDLVVGGEQRTHFDSGPLFEGAELPRIDIAASIHGGFCRDTVLHVVAEPAPGRVCGGIAGLPCDEGEFCKFPIGSCCCDQLGVCAPIPGGCTTHWDPVCGCDGITYGNECESDMAGVSVAHRGACGNPCFSDAHCADSDQFCRFADGTCGATGSQGECTPVPSSFPDVWGPVCGCDGVTYGSGFEADAAAMSIRHDGECRQLPVSPRNPSGRRYGAKAGEATDRPPQPGL